MSDEVSKPERYRLYIDESGDHVFRHTDEPGHRYLCLLGCFMSVPVYKAFHAALGEFLQTHIPHNPDDPVILHREDIINHRGAFWRLRNEMVRDAFDADLLDLLQRTDFRVIAVVIDKHAHRLRYPQPAHPYHLGLGYMLQRYCGFLNHISRQGDVMAESRGAREDRLLSSSYEFVYDRGVWGVTKASFFQSALTSRQLKLKSKQANIAGLQLADLLAHPVRQSMLLERGRVPGPLGRFAEKLMPVIETKFNRHLYKDRVRGYGKVFFPENE
ncbi:MAG: DUF3800 domain-containing protein [Candidatus Hydrogenedentes bacterium]|nr:DUF3800 domain-containing protein [Candidatus Hydrogenedentota bacterium]